MAAESAQRTSIQSPPPDTARKTRRSERKAEAATATTTAAADHAPVTASRTRRLRGAHDSLNALGSLADAALQAHPMPEDELDDAVGEVAQAVTVEALRGAAQALQGKGGEGEDAADDEGVEDELGEVDDDEDEYEDGEEGEEDDGEGEGEGDEYAAPAGKRRKRSAAKQPKKEPRVKRAKPLAAPRNRWGRSQNDVDADLRTLLDTPDKAQAYLASKWIDAKELHRLEELRLITYKRGKWTEGERLALRNHISAFKEQHSLTDTALLEIILSKGRFDKRSEYPHFWAELAERVPGRPVKYVVTAVQRMYDPRARKGAWTPDEDTKLLEAYAEHPNKWTTIADIVCRTVHDCRDRWKCELRDKDKRKKGPWTEEETVRLREAVIKANTDAGLTALSSDTPWDAVVKLMDETRSRTQCRKKWQDTMGYGQRTETARKRGSKLDSRVLLSRMRELGIEHEADVEYARVTLPEWGLTPAQVRRKWNHLKSLIPNRETGSFNELLDLIEANLKPDDWRKRKRGERADDGENAEASGSGISNGLVNGNGNDHIHPNVAADGTAIIDDSHVQAYEMQQQAGIPLNGVETEEAIISAAMVEMVAQQVVG